MIDNFRKEKFPFPDKFTYTRSQSISSS